MSAPDQAPTITGVTTTDQVTDDKTPISPFAGVTISDPDDPAQTQTLTVEAFGGSLANLGSGSFSEGTYTVTGTAAQVTAAIDALVFIPDTTGTIARDPFFIHDSDGALTASDFRTTVVVNPTNHIPTITGASANLTTGDKTPISPFADVTIGDVDDPAQTQTLSVEVFGSGSLSNLGAGTYNAATRTYTVTGTAAQVTAAIDGLIFTPVATGVGESNSFLIKDSDGTLIASDWTTRLTVNPTDHLPTITGTSANLTMDDKTPISPFAGVTIGDVDSPAQTQTLTVYVEGGGSLTNLGSGTFSDGKYTVSGTAAQVTAEIDGLVFVPAFPLSSRENTTLGISDSDGTFTANDDRTTVVVTPTDHAPTIAGTMAAQPVTSQGSIAPFASVIIGDVDSPAQTLTLRVQMNNIGFLSNPGSGSLDAARQSYTVSGTAADVTAALDGLVFTPLPNLSAPGTTTTFPFDIQVSDGVLTTYDSTTTVSILTLDNPPIITGTKPDQKTTDDRTISPFLNVRLNDIDVGQQIQTLTVTLDDPAKGILYDIFDTFGPRGLGATESYDRATGVYSITGPANNVSMILGGLVFRPAPVPLGSTETASFTIFDSDGTLSATDSTTSVTITGTEHAPTITGATTTGQVTDDRTPISPFAGVTIGDIDSPAQTQTLTVSIVNRGTFSNLGGFVYDAAGDDYTISGTAAQVTAALDGLVYVPGPPTGATQTVALFLEGTDGTELAFDNGTTVIVNPTSHAPTIAGVATTAQATNDDTPIAPFGGVTIGNVEAPAQTLSLTVRVDPGGNLSNLGGGSFDARTDTYTLTGTAAQLTTALDGLMFIPQANLAAPGTSHTYAFSIGVSNGTLATFNDDAKVVATSVDDAPTIAGTRAGQAANDETAISPFAGVTIGDVDQPAHTQTLTVRLDDATKGLLSNFGIGSYDAATGVYSVSGLASQVTAALDGLAFTPTINGTISGATVTTRFTITVSDGTLSTSDETTTVAVVSPTSGDAGNNVLRGGPDSLLLYGLDGNDTIYGGGGNDSAYGGNGNDVLIGSFGRDLLPGDAGDDYLQGGSGEQSLFGGAGNDILVAGSGSDMLQGGAGNDTLYAGSGFDYLYGGDGSNILIGGSGFDVLEGGTGDDHIYLENNLGGGLAYGGGGNDVGIGDNGNDVFVMGNGDDVIYGEGGQDYVYAGAGNDTMYGGDGVDVLIGGAGNDYFDGGTGVNYYFGGSGGGPGTSQGNDTFVLNAQPGVQDVQVVQDWTEGLDHVLLTGTGFTSMHDLRAHSYQNGAYYVIQPDADNAIWLNGATAATITAADISIAS